MVVARMRNQSAILFLWDVERERVVNAVSSSSSVVFSCCFCPGHLRAQLKLLEYRRLETQNKETQVSRVSQYNMCCNIYRKTTKSNHNSLVKDIVIRISI